MGFDKISSWAVTKYRVVFGWAVTKYRVGFGWAVTKYRVWFGWAVTKVLLASKEVMSTGVALLFKVWVWHCSLKYGCGTAQQ